MDGYVRRAKQADVIILGLGLCELWWDREIEAYLNVPPGGANGSRSSRSVRLSAT